MQSTKHQIPSSKQAPRTEAPSTKHRFDLEERTLNFSKRVIRFCSKLDHHVINRELVAQVIRASGSVGANYREANEALSKKDFSHRIKIARREAKEACYWLQLLAEANSPDGDGRGLEQEALELQKILSAISGKVRSL